MITSIVVVSLLVGVGAGADGAGHAEWTPTVIYYAPYPVWFPKYLGPSYSDYQVVQYVTPPAVTAGIVKQRILAINAANPELLPAPIAPLPQPRPDLLPPVPDKVTR